MSPSPCETPSSGGKSAPLTTLDDNNGKERRDDGDPYGDLTVTSTSAAFRKPGHCLPFLREGRLCTDDKVAPISELSNPLPHYTLPPLFQPVDADRISVASPLVHAQNASAHRIHRLCVPHVIDRCVYAYRLFSVAALRSPLSPHRSKSRLYDQLSYLIICLSHLSLSLFLSCAPLLLCCTLILKIA
jgi:hypothetical protein